MKLTSRKALLINDDQGSILVLEMPITHEFENVEDLLDLSNGMRPIGTMNDSNIQFVVIVLGRHHKIEGRVTLMHSLVNKADSESL